MSSTAQPSTQNESCCVFAALLQISLSTRDVFIECTATDLTKAKVVLNTGAGWGGGGQGHVALGGGGLGAGLGGRCTG